MIDVSLRDFLQTGRFGPVELGMPSAKVEGFLGAADSLGASSSRARRPFLWKYGEVEFHFLPRKGKDDQLVLVFLEHFNVPSGGPKVRIDPWFIRGGLSLDAVEREFRAAGLKTRSFRREHLQGATELVVEKGASLLFGGEGLYSISFSGDLEA